jgi:hypothetical protein
MKAYTAEEREAAQKKIPRPIQDFLRSPALVTIYQGIQKKLALDLRQMLAVVEITSATLEGLEPESAMETNIHQLLHELSNEKTRELVADINDRIFKEAKRRLEGNVLEAPARVIIAEPTDAELETLGEKEKREGILPEFEKAKQEELALQSGLKEEEAKRAIERAQGLGDQNKIADEGSEEQAPSIKLGQSGVLKAAEEKLQPPISGPSIAATKLSAPSTVAPTETVAQQPLANPSPQPAPRKMPPIQKRVDGIDPYREPLG